MINKLEQVDKYLATVQVSGDSAFALVRARNLLKEIYDELKNLDKHSEV